MTQSNKMMFGFDLTQQKELFFLVARLKQPIQMVNGKDNLLCYLNLLFDLTDCKL